MRYTTLMAMLAPMMLGMALRAAEPIAVVELFTSEGCSSCPPADKHAGELADEAGKDGRNLFVLSFHVDYWDSLGWKDPYSSKEATARQSAYAMAWRARSAYTPQMVVNGAVGFVGSDRSRAEQEIDKALAQDAPVELDASVKSEGKRTLEVHAIAKPDAQPIRRDWDIVAALVERGLTQKPKRGENKGRTLTHDNVVRVFGVKELTGDDATIELKIPKGVDREKSDVIVLVQDRKTLKILGATRVELPERE